jgi:anti-sigma factor RsiW
VRRRPVATLLYRHRKHLISLTAVPEADSKISPATARTSDGYNVIRWDENGMTYWAVSDLGTADLSKFVDLFRAAVREL